MKNFVMYNEGDFRAFLLGLKLKPNDIDQIVKDGNPTDADNHSLVKLNTDIAPDGKTLILSRDAMSEKHSMKVVIGTTSDDVPVDVKIPPRNEDKFRVTLKKMGYRL